MAPDEPPAGSGASGGEPVPEELHRWVAHVADELSVDPDTLDVDRLLAVAREVGHQVLRPAVPVTTFLIGYAVGSSGGDRARLDVLLRQVEALTRAWRG